jgi:hypothetical protein
MLGLRVLLGFFMTIGGFIAFAGTLTSDGGRPDSLETFIGFGIMAIMALCLLLTYL